MTTPIRQALLCTLLVALCGVTRASPQSCDIDGAHVNPANGHTTAGKTGIMRCRDGSSGQLQREEELRNGAFVGLVRFYKDGVLLKEHQRNERGNRDGLAREYAGTAGANPVVREETLRNGTTVGLARSWYPDGVLRRVSHHGDDGRETAVAEFTRKGQLKDLRCAERALLAPHADDAQWCGHQGAARAVTLHAEDGQVSARLTFERGQRRAAEWLWPNGKPRAQEETTATGGTERSFRQDGSRAKEVEWLGQGRERRTVAEREFHDSGTLVRERRWADGVLKLEQQWYLNGQPRSKVEFSGRAGEPAQRHESGYHDNGRLAYEGSWLMTNRYDGHRIGIHRRFDPQGQLRQETHFDPRGRANRERELDENGRVLRDDEVFEDGSRKAYSR